MQCLDMIMEIYVSPPFWGPSGGVSRVSQALSCLAVEVRYSRDQVGKYYDLYRSMLLLLLLFGNELLIVRK
jgi:hypothetical protein